MRPIDSKTGKPWNEVNANAMLRDIKAEAVRQLKARDKARGIPEDGKMYREVERDPEHPDELPKMIVPDPELAHVKRSCGRDLNLLIKYRWMEFISEPRDEASYALETSTTERAAALIKAKAVAASVEASLTHSALETTEQVTMTKGE